MVRPINFATTQYSQHIIELKLKIIHHQNMISIPFQMDTRPVNFTATNFNYIQLHIQRTHLNSWITIIFNSYIRWDIVNFIHFLLHTLININCIIVMIPMHFFINIDIFYKKNLGWENERCLTSKQKIYKRIYSIIFIV